MTEPVTIINFTTESDADFRMAFHYQSGLFLPNPVDLTGATMYMKVRHHVSDRTAALVLTTENGGVVITDAPNGNFQIVIETEQLTQIAPGVYQQSMVMSQGPAQTLIWRGTFTHTYGPSR